MIDALAFWLLLEAIGLIGLPFAGLLFARLPGGGLALARPIGLLLVAYPLWLLASVRAVPYERWTAVLTIVAVAAAGLALWLRTPRLRRPGRATLQLLAVSEVLFALAFFGWTLLHSFSPDVWQTEKPMDMAIINSVDRGDSFPPHDPWFAGNSLNYYYYGHYLVGFLIRVSGIDPARGFNLGVSLFYALSLTAVFAVASALYLAARERAGAPARSPVLPGLAAAAFAMVAGNLAGTVEFFEHPGRMAGYDWWSPSRVIPHTANEFPFFSFLLADLHAHVMAAPFALVALAFALQLCLRGPRLPSPAPASWLPAAGELLLGALILGSLYAINSLDYPTQLGLGILAILLWLLSSQGGWLRTTAWAATWAGASVLLFLPFWIHYSPTSKGIALVADHTRFSSFLKYEFLIYGTFFWVLATAFVDVLRLPRRYLIWGGVVLTVALVLLSPPRLAALDLVLATAAFAFYVTLAGSRPQAYRFLWLLVAAALVLVGVGEFAYIRDVFEATPSYRFNTVFKAGYQAWFLLSVAAGCALFWSQRWLGRRVRLAWVAGLGVLLVLSTAYPIAGSYARSGAFRRSPTLDGMAWLESKYPGDAAAIDWLRRSVHGAPTVLEAVGPDYDPEGSARVSTFTGLPTVLGWHGHEVQWGHDPGRRAADVTRIYEARDLRVARSLLARYRVRYVFVGAIERRNYPREGLRKFERLGQRVFASRGTVVYRVDDAASAPSASSP